MFRRLAKAVLGRDLPARASLLLTGSRDSILVRPLGHILRFALAAVLARSLGASDYGMYAYAVTWMGLVQIPAALGLEHVVLRFVPMYRDDGDITGLRALLSEASRAALLSGVAAALIAITVTMLIPGIDSTLRLTVAITFGALPFSVFAPLRQATLRAFDRPVRGQLPEHLVYPGGLALALLLWLLVSGGLTAPEAAFLNVCAWGTAFSVGTVLVLKAVPPAVEGRRAPKRNVEWKKLVLPLLMAGMSYNLLSRVDIIVLGAFASDADVGIYAMAQRLGELVLFAYEAMTMAGASVFAATYVGGDRDELQRLSIMITRVILSVSFPIMVGTWILAPYLLSMFGPEFVAGAPVLRFLATTYFVSSLGGFIIVMQFITGGQSQAAKVMFGCAVINLIGSVVLAPRFGMLGAAVASGGSLILAKGILVWTFHRRTGVWTLPFAKVPARADSAP